MAIHPNPIDIDVGSRIRVRRKQLGMSQAKLAKAISLSFHQMQKNERGTNRVGSSRLYQISQVLEVPISYFFDDMPAEISGKPGLAMSSDFDGDPLAKRETQQLVRAYYRIPSQRLRNQVRKLMRALAGPN